MTASRNRIPTLTEEGEFSSRLPELITDPFPTFDHLRRKDPIHYRASRSDWVVSRYHDVCSVLTDPRFGRGRRRDADPRSGDSKGEDVDVSLESLLDVPMQHLSWPIHLNPPRHTHIRSIVTPVFGVGQCRKWALKIEEMVDARIASARRDGGLEVMSQLADPLAFQVICGFLGIPATSMDRVIGWTKRLALAYDMDADECWRSDAQRAWEAVVRHILRFTMARPERPDSLLSVLVAAHRQGRLSRVELLANLGFFLLAGQETTRKLIGNSLFALLADPVQLTLLRCGRVPVRTAVEELLRRCGPAQSASCTAWKNVELRDRHIEEGATVHLLLGSANHDPEQFPGPEALDLGRRPNPHVAFGKGAHFCVGANLARLEAEIAITALIREAPQMRLARDPEWAPGFSLRGLDSLHVEF